MFVDVHKSAILILLMVVRKSNYFGWIWNFLQNLKLRIPTEWELTSIIENYSGNPLQKTAVSLHRHTAIWAVITASIDLRISGITRSSFSSRSIESCEISNNVDQLFGTFKSFLWWKNFNLKFKNKFLEPYQMIFK